MLGLSKLCVPVKPVLLLVRDIVDANLCLFSPHSNVWVLVLRAVFHIYPHVNPRNVIFLQPCTNTGLHADTQTPREDCLMGGGRSSRHHTGDAAMARLQVPALLGCAQAVGSTLPFPSPTLSEKRNPLCPQRDR